MAKSIIDNSNYCYICSRYKCRYTLAKHTHHCISGTANRQLADEDGLTVRLCPKCHDRLHAMSEHKRDLQIIAEKAWLDHYGKTIQDFIERYGQNYIF